MSSKVTAIIVTWNSSSLLPELLKVLEDIKPLCNVIVSDNASTDSTPDIIQDKLPWVKILRNSVNGGFGYGNNRALDICVTPYVLFLNTDACISASAVERLTEILENNESAAAVQPLIRLWQWPLITLSAGAAMTEYGRGYDYDFMHFQPFPSVKTVEVPAVTAAVSLFRRETVMEAGGFDERIFMYYEDTDLCLRLRERGYSFLLAHSVEAEHIMGVSSNRRIADRWELESSAYIARKYLGGKKCQLPAYWKKMELKTRLYLMLRRKHWFWRTTAVRKAEKIQVKHVDLPDSVMQDIIAPRPLRMPYKRPADNSQSLYAGNEVIFGPGWIDGRIDECGFGCIQVPSCRGSLVFTAGSLNISGSLALWSLKGVIIRRFLRISEKSVFTAVIDEGITHLYLVPDRRKQRIKVDNVSYST